MRGRAAGEITGLVEQPYLEEVLHLIWPDSTLSVGKRLNRSPGRRRGPSFYALPSARHPVMLLPTVSRGATSTALRESRTGASAGRRRLLRGLSVVARVGLTGVVADRITVQLPEDAYEASLVSWLSLRLGQSIQVALSASPPRANRKPVLHLITESGTTLGFAKVGHNPLTRRLVDSEARVLSRLGTHPSPGLRVPRVILHDQWRGLDILVQEPLVRRGAHRGSAASAVRIMSAFARRDGLLVSDLKSSPYIERLGRRIDAITDDPQMRSGFGRELAEVISHEGANALSLGLSHGDFAPWNYAPDGDGLVVWDWERFESDVPLGFDALHLAFQGAVTRGHIPATQAAQQLFARAHDLLEPFGVDRQSAEATAVLYLLDIAVRYSTDGQRLMRAPLADVENWLLPALAARRSASAGG